MKITRNDTPRKPKLTFADLKPGETFEFCLSGDDEYLDGRGPFFMLDDRAYVSLGNSGAHRWIETDSIRQTPVRLVNVELVVTRP